METPGAHPHGRGARLFGGLGRAIVRHPWYPIAFWVILFLVVLPFLPAIGSVTTNSATNTSPNAPSTVAAAELARLFPNGSTAASSSLVLLVGPNVTTPTAQRAIINITNALEEDRSIVFVQSISSVYTAAAGYLAGQTMLASAVIQAGLNASPSAPTAVNRSASVLWAPPALYVSNWVHLVTNNSSTDPHAFDLPAFNETRSQLAGQALPLQALQLFYGNGSGSGFNGSFDCAGEPLAMVPTCAEAAARSTETPLIPQLAATPAEQVVPSATLATLGLTNYTLWSSVRATVAVALSVRSGASAAWIDRVWTAFPHGFVNASSATAFGGSIVAGSTLWTLPLPLPYAIRSQYVDRAGTASIVNVGYTVDSSYTTSSGAVPVYANVEEVDRVVDRVLPASDPSRSISYLQTGSAALDQNEQVTLNASLAIVLPLTVIVLIGITMIYFRSPLTPAVTFAGIGISLVLGLGGTILIGTLIGHVDSTALTLEETFVLGVGTDYSIFLVARYREELVQGARSDDAIVTAVTWAGQSVATSGSTAIISTLALAFSGVALLSQWGSVLSLAILLTVLISLTLIPACLSLLGPRIFWPNTGERFRRHAQLRRTEIEREDTYFYRTGRAVQRHPWLTVGVIALVSVPLLLVAVQVPLSYDFYDQLPSSQPAIQGLNQLGSAYGPGYAFPSYALVTFATPVFPTSTTVNSTELTELSQVTSVMANTSGIASVQSMIGPYGAPLSTWSNLSEAPPAVQIDMGSIADQYVGNDGRTVYFGIQTTASGLSNAAIQAIESVSSSVSHYTGGHPAITGVAYGGGAPVSRDIAQQTFTATERMILAVSIGLVLVLLLVLRSWIIPIMAVATIGLSLGWAWGATYVLFTGLLGLPLFYFVPTVLFILILGLGIDYNIFLLTRVREERDRGQGSSEAVVQAVARTGGIITAAAIILASAFAILTVGSFTLLRAIGFAVAIAVLLDAMVIRTFLVPAFLHLLGDRVWELFGGRKMAARVPAEEPPVSSTADPVSP